MNMLSNHNEEINRHSQLLVIKFIVFTAFVAMSLPYSILPALFMHAKIGELFFFKEISIQSSVLFAMSVYPLGMFFGTYCLGSFSDKLGKRRVLLISLGLASVCQVLSSLCIIENFLNFFIFTRFFAGLFEGNISIARASIASLCLTEGDRKKHLAQINVALTLGWVVGPPIGALLSQVPIFNGYFLPFLFGAFLTMVTYIFSYCYFFEPIPLKSIKNNNNIQCKLIGLKSGGIFILFLVSFLLFLGVDAYYLFIPVYLSIVLKASPLILALAATIVGVSYMLSNLFLIPFLHKKISTMNTVIGSSSILSFCLFCFALSQPNIMLLFLLPIIGITIALVSPNLSAYISMQLNDSKQGSVMGILSSQRTLGVAIMSLLFALFLNAEFRVPFIFGGLFLLMGVFFLILFLFVKRKAYCVSSL